MNLKEVDEEIKNTPETVFDTFKMELNSSHVGGALREQLVELSNLFGRISQLAANASLLYERAKNRRDKVEALAWNKIDKEIKIAMQKILIKTIPVDIDGIMTTLNDEDARVLLYEYIYSRGRDKVKEISTILDVGRTLLSWDKQEQSKVQYD